MVPCRRMYSDSTLKRAVTGCSPASCPASGAAGTHQIEPCPLVDTVFLDCTASVWPRRKPSRKACQPATGREDRRLAWVDSWVDSDGAEPPAEELRAGFSRHGRRLTPTRNRCKCKERMGSIQTHPRGRQRRAWFR